MSAIERIEARNVSRRFGNTMALRAVTVTFHAGEIAFIEGPNGAGKSTLLGVLGTLLKPTLGTVSYEPFGADREAARAHIGWVAHEARCYRQLTGRQNVELAARLYGFDPRRSWERVASRVDALGFADQPVGTLSRGQKQRIALARALVHQPSVLLLDEPLSGLDRASIERLEEILRDERDRGSVVVVVSHTAALMGRLAGRRLTLQRGRVVSDTRKG